MYSGPQPGAAGWYARAPPGSRVLVPASLPPMPMPIPAVWRVSRKTSACKSPSELNAAGGASVKPSCQCLQAIPN
jgi:hypothetical protein